MLRRVRLRLASFTAVVPRAMIALLMIGSLFLAQFGYPVWEAANKGDEPFPCQHRRCGCRTAEQCRQSCCCHTKQQKIAWAVGRGLDPGKFVDLTPADKIRLAMDPPSQTVAKSCCKDGVCSEGTTCETRVAMSASKNCCSPKPACCQTKGQSKGRTVRWVLAFEAQKCSGTGVEWIQAGFIGQPPLKVTLTIIPHEEHVTSERPLIYFSPVQEPLLRPV